MYHCYYSNFVVSNRPPHYCNKMVNAILTLIMLTILYRLRAFQLSMKNLQNKHNNHLIMSLLSSIKSSDELLKGTTLNGQQLVRIFVASKDGWDSSTFHQNVDYDPSIPIITICKTQSGHSFQYSPFISKITIKLCTILGF